jgi:hypothetical protein
MVMVIARSTRAVTVAETTETQHRSGRFSCSKRL